MGLRPEEKSFFEKGRAVELIKQHAESSRRLRIATAYFELSGYRLLRESLKNKTLDLMIGRSERGVDQVQAVLSEFLQSLNSAEPGERYHTIVSMRDALKDGRLKTGVSGSQTYLNSDNNGSLETRYLYHHAKLYFFDERAVLVTSANFTYPGLVTSREAGYLVTTSLEVSYLLERFEIYFAESVNISEQLAELLEAWLKIYSPREIYLKTLLELYADIDSTSARRLPELADYQKPVVARVSETIREHGGALLVAATGLGKTVMAGHIAILLATDKESSTAIDNVIVLCPAGLRHTWRRTMRSARLSSREYSYHALNNEDWLRNNASRYLQHDIDDADEQTLLILDESHHIRNVENPGASLEKAGAELRRALKKNVKTLLLTATPFSRNRTDIHSQLSMVPGYSERFTSDIHNFFTSDSDMVNSFNLRNSPYAVVLAAPTVVRYYAENDSNNHRFVRFADRRMYFPVRLHLQTVSFKSSNEEYLRQLLSRKLLRKRVEADPDQQPLFHRKADSGRRDPLFEARLMHQFFSSPAEAANVIKKMKREGGFEKMRFAAQTALTEFIKENSATLEKPSESEKYRHLGSIIEKHPDEKIVVFCHYRETAIEVNRELAIRSNRQVVSTLDADPDKLEFIVQQFAPVASEVEDRVDESASADVLIATGALSEGFNLQDASVLVNFDIPWTVLVLAQRMGRILRPWPEPRDVYIYNLIPSSMNPESKNPLPMAVNWAKRLAQRSSEHLSFARLPAYIDKDRESVAIEELAGELSVHSNIDLSFDDAMEFIENATDPLHSSSFLNDLARIPQVEKKALLKLPAGSRSAIQKPEGMLFIMFRFRRRFFPVLFDRQGFIEADAESSEEILSIIRSDEKIPGVLDPEKHEHKLLEARDRWAFERGVDSSELEIISSMLI